MAEFMSVGDVCPEFVICETSVKKGSCPEGTFFRDKVKVHGCCPGCVSLKGEGESCESTGECQPGLKCGDSKKCEGDPSQACEYYKRYDRIWKKRKYWNPVCEADGSFAPKQCKGERMAGKCFCVSEDGRRIFGEEEWSASDNMTCGCSRMADVMTRKGAKVTLHCDALGNFELLQCDQKVCWCANPSTGIPYTPMVPLQMMTSLSCYSRNAIGAQYQRQCDSVNYIQQVTKSLLVNHGVTGITFLLQQCNLDGSYHRVQAFREKKRCVYRNNSPLTEAVPSDDADCNCAYDRHVADLRQTDFLADCLPNGNYRTRQFFNGKVYCLDADGFHFSDDPEDCPSS